MKAQNTSRNIPDRMESAFAVARSGTSGPRAASVHMLDSSTRPGQHRSFVESTPTPSTLKNQMVNFLVDVEAYLFVVRLLVKELLTEMQSGFCLEGC